MPTTFFILVMILLGSPVLNAQPGSRLHIPLGGNSWVTVKAKGGKEQVTDSGWLNWENKQAVFSTYIRPAKAGELKISAVFNVPAGTSRVRCGIGNQNKVITVSGTGKEIPIGSWTINAAGYVKIDMQGISRSGKVFATIKELIVSGSCVDEQLAYVKSNEDNYFYWGRRGPSVHINYDLSSVGDDIEWFYNEITVPAGNDITGSFFMANGFAEGYFGMQVNSPTERRILFSVWSPFATDDPKQVPADKRVLLLQKGKDVYTGEFGNEGSGGQSYLRYPWKAGTTYKFLLHAKPVENSYTNYSAYFYATELKQWRLIARFSRPATRTYLKRLHSFLENFDPATGYISRGAFYHHQWVFTAGGEWKPLSKMSFTGDATAQKGYRMDYAGGAENGKFFLRNDGFFNAFTPLRSVFSVIPGRERPAINLQELQKPDDQ